MLPEFRFPSLHCHTTTPVDASNPVTEPSNDHTNTERARGPTTGDVRRRAANVWDQREEPSDTLRARSSLSQAA
eukprot:752331-Hanusia_phi.AAC.1